MTNSATKIFGENGLRYWERGLPAIPVKPNSKQPAISKWTGYNHNLPGETKKAEWLREYADCGIGLPLGIEFRNGRCLGAVDIDDPRLVGVVRAALGSAPCTKRGKKGETIFVQFEKGLKSRKVAPKGSKPRVEFFLNTGMVAIPPSIHPDTGAPYEWGGAPLHEIDLSELPLLTEDLMQLICLIVQNEHTEVVLGGEGTHDAMLRLAAQTHRFADPDHLVEVLAELLPDGYSGNTLTELPDMVRSAASKQLGAIHKPTSYDPGDVGPIPLGHLPDGSFALRLPETNRIAGFAPQSLVSDGMLLGLAPGDFWMNQFPKFTQKGVITGIDVKTAADAIMQACRKKGPFDMARVRGRGVWLEKGQVVVNLGGELPEGIENHYVCFYPLPSLEGEPPAGKAVLETLRYFNWSRDGDTLLLLGWLKIAPVCGALGWRPHLFVTGAKNTGKTTLVRAVEGLLEPLVIVLDGTSTEAGIRQKLGPDSLPVVLDEFESDQNRNRMQAIVKLARSASSTQGSVARGTPEGKALEFAIRTTFLFAAINPVPGTAADASRLIALELLPHGGDQEIRAEIERGLAQMAASNGGWCQQAIVDLPTVLAAIELFRQAMPPIDSRHATNMATLLAGAFVALEGRLPDQDDVSEWVEQSADLIEHHAEAHEEDDALACLNHLLGSPAGRHPVYQDRQQATVGEFVQLVLNDRRKDGQSFVDATILHQFGIRVDGPDAGIIANNHPGLERIFDRTRWAGGAWRTALARLDGATKPDKKFRFAGSQSRAVEIPARYFPDPSEIETPPIDF